MALFSGELTRAVKAAVLSTPPARSGFRGAGAIVALGAIALAGCSSGGSAGPGAALAPTPAMTSDPAPIADPAPDPAPPSPNFRTPEYNNSGGLEQINVVPAYERGAAGAATLVAIIDTGIDVDNAEFEGRIDSRSADLVSPGIVSPSDERSGPVTLQDEEGHGTSVASIIGAARNDRGMHGVAPQAELLVYRANDEDDQLLIIGEALFEGIIRSADANAKVLNLSLGSNEAGAREGFQLYFNITSQADIVTAIAAGNERLDDPEGSALAALDPEARGTVIIVGAVDANGEISNFSNRAGIAQEFFLTAPGEFIPTVDLPSFGGGLISFSGTSASTPMVTGAAALIRGLWPQLTAAQVVDILLSSATDLGAPGVDPIYGHGLLNVGAALQPAGATATASATGARITGIGANASAPSAAFVSSPVFGGVVPVMGDFVFVDQFGRDFRGDLNRFAASQDAFDVRLDAVMQPFTHRVQGARSIGRGVLRMRLARHARRFTNPDDAFRASSFDAVSQGSLSLDARAFSQDRVSIAAQYPLSDQFSVSMSQGFVGREADAGLDMLGARAVADQVSLTRDGFHDAFLPSGRDTMTAAAVWRLGPNATVDILAAQSFDEAQSALRFGVTRSVAANAVLRLETGVRSEEDAILGARVGGLLSEAASSTTYYGALAAGAAFPAGWRLDGRFAMGRTQLDARGGLLVGVRDLTTRQAALALSKSGIFGRRDRMTLYAARPLQAIDGAFVLSAATAYDPLLATFTTERRESALSQAARAGDIGLSYATRAGHDAALSFSVIRQFNTGVEVDDSVAALMQAAFRF